MSIHWVASPDGTPQNYVRLGYFVDLVRLPRSCNGIIYVVCGYTNALAKIVTIVHYHVQPSFAFRLDDG